MAIRINYPGVTLVILVAILLSSISSGDAASKHAPAKSPSSHSRAFGNDDAPVPSPNKSPAPSPNESQAPSPNDYPAPSPNYDPAPSPNDDPAPSPNDVPAPAPSDSIEKDNDDNPSDDYFTISSVEHTPTDVTDYILTQMDEDFALAAVGAPAQSPSNHDAKQGDVSKSKSRRLLSKGWFSFKQD